MKRYGIGGVLVATAMVICACGGRHSANARKQIRELHLPEVVRILNDDIHRHEVGLRKVAERVVPGFAVADPTLREQQMRSALHHLHIPPRGVQEIMSSPLTFIAAVDPSGVVIARDAEPDRLKGRNFAEIFPIVASALHQGREGHAIGELPGLEASAPGTKYWIFVAPSRRDGNVVGAVVIGIPLWRLEQRVSRQLKLDHMAEQGLIVWTYVYQGDDLFYQTAAHPELDAIVPNAQARRAGLERSPHGYTTEGVLYGRSYAFGIVPMPILGEDAGFIFVRSDPL
ncbi:MAG: hypothetical protein IPK60_01920 [Sandaracinaceae bacterium]|nr:hypothetical protein [Sandaracinaceae bacterium]